jgi:TolB-like protein/Flp pilus assembly protein TadD
MLAPLTRRQARMRFGEFELDPETRELRRHGECVSLQEQPLRLLGVLLASAGQVVTREQLRAELWPDDVYVDFEHGLNTAVRRLRDVLGDAADHPRFVETLPRRGYRFIAPVERTASDHGTRRTAVAVLPFLNLTANPDNAYLADGVTEDLITELAHVPALKVVSRTSAMQFKGSDRNVREIARALRVDVIVEGSVRQTGDRLRITARLIDARTDEQLWAEDYDRHLADVLDLQKAVALSVTTALAPDLTSAERSRIGSPGTSDVEAYHLYLRGRHCMFQFTENGLRQGIEYFERAAARDPSYALPHAGIGFAYMVVGGGHGAGAMPLKDAYARSRAAIDRALRIDPRLGQAHGTDACLRFMGDFDWAGAERAFGQAFALGPESAETFDTYGLFVSALGRFDEALEAQRHAHDLDPLAPVVMSDIATTLLRTGRYAEAEAQARELVRLEPAFPLGHSTLGWAHIKQGRGAEGILELQAAVRLCPGNTLLVGQLGQAHGMTGSPDDAREVLASLQAAARERYVSPYHLAYVHTGLGEHGAAMDCLEQAVAERVGGVYGIKGSFLFTDLRGHPRFNALLRTMNLS